MSSFGLTPEEVLKIKEAPEQATPTQKQESISTKNVKLPKRKKPKGFVVKEFNYDIEKSR